jgi:hypothetical protein
VWAAVVIFEFGLVIRNFVAFVCVRVRLGGVALWAQTGGKAWTSDTNVTRELDWGTSRNAIVAI